MTRSPVPILAPGPSGRILALNIRAGGGGRVGRLLAFLEMQDPVTIVLSEWRANPAGQRIADWARARGMHAAGLADGRSANGILVASRREFGVQSLTPRVTVSGVLLRALPRLATAGGLFSIRAGQAGFLRSLHGTGQAPCQDTVPADRGYEHRQSVGRPGSGRRTLSQRRRLRSPGRGGTVDGFVARQPWRGGTGLELAVTPPERLSHRPRLRQPGLPARGGAAMPLRPRTARAGLERS
jgi:hypothetical protein